MESIHTHEALLLTVVESLLPAVVVYLALNYYCIDYYRNKLSHSLDSELVNRFLRVWLLLLIEKIPVFLHQTQALLF